MRLVIPRGVVYHDVWDDVSCLLRAVFAPLDEESTVRKFEESFAAYVGRRHALAFPSARTAILSALQARGLPPGSSILMPPITIKPILDVVLSCGLKPVFVDLDPDTLCFDLAKLRDAITPDTRAILITYLVGLVPDMGALMDACRAHDLFVIEDFSQCLNGTYGGKKVGTFGDVGVYSSSFIKTLDTYGGGQTICDDDALFEALRERRDGMAAPSRGLLMRRILIDLCLNVATTRWVFHMFAFPLLRLIRLARPERAVRHLGPQSARLLARIPAAWFHRFSSLQAEVGLRLLSEVEAGDAARRKHVGELKELLKASRLRFPEGVPGAGNVYWQLVAQVKDAKRAQRFLHARGIDTSTTSLTHIAALPNSPHQGDTPWAKELHENGLFIPAYPGLRDSDVRHMAAALSHEDANSFL
jgi:perosamine synthetase